jgi:hypothetical protein
MGRRQSHLTAQNRKNPDFVTHTLLASSIIDCLLGYRASKPLRKVLKLHNKAQDRDSGTVSSCGVQLPKLGQPTIQGGIKIFLRLFGRHDVPCFNQKATILAVDIRKTGTFIQKIDAEILFHLLGNHFISKAEEAKHE